MLFVHLCGTQQLGGGGGWGGGLHKAATTAKPLHIIPHILSPN